MKHWMTTWGPAVLAGLVMSFAFPRYHLFPLAWVALAPLVARTAMANARAAFLHFFVAGAVFYLLLLQWLLANVFWVGGWAVVGYMLLSLAMAVYWGLAGAAWRWARAVPYIPAALALAVIWYAMEWLQGLLLTGFGWGWLGYSQGPDLAVAQWAALGATPLVSAVLVGTGALLGEAWAGRERRGTRLAAAAALAALAHGGGWLMLDAPEPRDDRYHVGLFESAFPLEMKWDREYTAEMVRSGVEKSRQLAAATPVDLFIWPEAALMAPVGDARIRPLVENLVTSTDTPLFTGAVRTGEEGAFYNSSVLLEADGSVAGHYDKVHLAPFGEYVPLGDLIPFVAKVVPAIGDITPGRESVIFDAAGRAFGPLICFEVLFPGMALDLAAMDADFLVVITNLAWFGESTAIAQEAEIARFRAIEARLPLVHSANTGDSGVFDPWGRFASVWEAPAHGGEAFRWGRRIMAALPVPPQAVHPAPWAPRTLPWVAVVLAAVLTGAGVAIRLRGGARPEKPAR
jgi:apolipoprotein N-acyltransferase